jgi:hypothetical protein
LKALHLSRAFIDPASRIKRARSERLASGLFKSCKERRRNTSSPARLDYFDSNSGSFLRLRSTRLRHRSGADHEFVLTTYRDKADRRISKLRQQHPDGRGIRRLSRPNYELTGKAANIHCHFCCQRKSKFDR